MEKKRILVVDDEVGIANLIRKILESENYQVDLSHDGKDGFVKVEKGNYDAIVLDIMLPKLNGFEVCKSLRENNVSTPLIMLSARDTIEDRLRASDAGADEYLSKPFSAEDLLSRVASILEKKVSRRDEPQEKEFLKSAAINKRIMDNVPVSIITLDKEGNIISANKYFRNLSKHGEYKEKNVFTENFFKRENLINDYRKLLSDGTEVKRDHCFERNVNGEDKYLKIMAVPLLDKEGNIDGAISMALDNTESVQLTKKLQLLNEELEKKVLKRTAQLDEANKELAKALELKAMFVGDVSHEMRTSLAIVQGTAELISRNLLKEEEKDDAYGQIFNEINRMSGMLSDMTLLSESETSKMRLDLRKTDLDQLISKTCLSLKNIAKDKKVEILHKKNRASLNVIVDVVQIEKLVVNLISNAIRYNKKNGQVEVWVENGKNEFKINVKDTGIGIPHKYQQDIFERFYRVDKARSRKDGGSGLGLAICKWVAEIHGGSISLESAVGEGSLFSVSLPYIISKK